MPTFNPDRDPSLTKRINAGKKVITYVIYGKVVTGGPTTQTTYHSGTIGNAPYSGTSSVMIDRPFETLETPSMVRFIIDSSGKIESWEDNRILAAGAYYPPIKPSNKAASHSSNISP